MAPTFDLSALLSEPGLTAAVATVTDRTSPALATMWFVHEDGRFWFHSPIRPPAPFVATARAGREVAVMVATFAPPEDVRQFRATGTARLEARDPGRVRRIYDRYVPAWSPEWSAHATSERFVLWSLLPEQGMAVAFPDLEDRPALRWRTATELETHLSRG